MTVPAGFKGLRFPCECVSSIPEGYSDPWAEITKNRLLPNGTKEQILNVLAQGPNFVAAANGHGQDRHSGFQRQSNRASFESVQFSIGLFATSLRKYDYCAAILEPLQRTSYGGRIAALDLQWPGAKQPEELTDQRPVERCGPGQEPERAFDGNTEPKGIYIGLMIGGYDQAAGLWNMMGSAIANLK